MQVVEKQFNSPPSLYFVTSVDLADLFASFQFVRTLSVLSGWKIHFFFALVLAFAVFSASRREINVSTFALFFSNRTRRIVIVGKADENLYFRIKKKNVAEIIMALSSNVVKCNYQHDRYVKRFEVVSKCVWCFHGEVIENLESKTVPLLQQKSSSSK